jgi:hypothetical protein
LRVGSRHLRKRYFSCVFVDGGASDSARVAVPSVGPNPALPGSRKSAVGTNAD